MIIIGLILNPNIRLRSEDGRAVLFTVTEGESVGETIFKFLHPQHATILALFDGRRDIPEVTEAVAHMFNIDLQTASKEVETLLDIPLNTEKTIRSLVIDASTIDLNTARVYDPNSFIVTSDRVDMSNPRCKWGINLSAKYKNAPPAKKPIVAGKGEPLDISIAGASNDQ